MDSNTMQGGYPLGGEQLNKEFFDRPRLTEALLSALKSPVVFLTAGTGYGKTQALLNAVKQTNAKVVWMQLIRLDNYAACFWEKFCDAISETNIGFADRLRRAGFPSTFEKTNDFLHEFARESYMINQVILVFDDFQRIYDEQILDFVENLISAGLENVCITIVSRQIPQFKVNDIFYKNRDAQLTSLELRFTCDETRQYLQRFYADIPEALVQDIYTETEGWPVAIHLIGLQLKKMPMERNELILYTMPQIFELIDHQFFREYPLHVQEILIKVSAMDDFPLEIIKVIAGEQFIEIVNILSHNLFVQYSPFSQKFTLHTLFLRFLRERLLFLAQPELNALFNQIATWYKQNNQVIDACEFFLRCENYDELWEIVRNSNNYDENYGDLINYFADLVQHFPQTYLDKQPLVRCFHAHLMIVLFDLPRAKAMFMQILKDYENLPLTSAHKEVLGEAYLGLAHIAIMQRDYSFARYYKLATDYLPGKSKLINDKQFYVENNDALFVFSFEKGSLDKIINILFEVMPGASETMGYCGYGMELLAAAEGNFFKSELNIAMEYAYQAIYRAKQRLQSDIVCSAYFLLMRIFCAKGDYPKIMECLASLNAYFDETGNPRIHYLVDVARGWFYTRVGRPDLVARWIMDDAINMKIHAPSSIGREQIVKAACFLYKKNYVELLAWIEEAEDQYEKRGLWFMWLQAKIIKAVCLYRIDHPVHAAQALEEAYNMAKGDGYQTLFAEFGNEMRMLADTVKGMEGHGIPTGWLSAISTKASSYAKRQAHIKGEYDKQNSVTAQPGVQLTPREKEILSSICQGLTREEIADSFGISINTVKSQLKNIYGKLGAINRSDAVRIASEIHLFDSP